MTIEKIQCASEDLAIECSVKLTKLKEKHVRLGSAIIVNVTPINTGDIATLEVEHKAHFLTASDFDKNKLLEIL